MYVKIIKNSRWYKNEDFIGSIFEVKEEKYESSNGTLFYELKKGNVYILQKECEVISLESENKISEEFADKHLFKY